MRPIKLFRRADDDRPTLKDRAAALKARLARITRRPDGSTDPQRRVMLAGSIAAALPLPVLAKGGHPDAELLALGRRHDAAVQAYLAFLPTFGPAEKRFWSELDAAVNARSSCSNDEWRALGEKIRLPHAAVLDRGESLRETWDQLSDAIINLPPPTTMEGAAVIARVVAAWHYDEWRKPDIDRNWDKRISTRLAAAVLRLAGVENVAAQAVAIGAAPHG